MKPLLASPADLDLIGYPVMVSPKLDGIRCLIIEGKPVSRTFKPFPNNHLNTFQFPENLDGELMTLTKGVLDDFNTVQSKIMSREGIFDFIFMVFDDFTDPSMHFEDRYKRLDERIAGFNHLQKVVHRYIYDESGLLHASYGYEALAYEGTMIRDPFGRYKFGRSTSREGILLKMKKFYDTEAVVIDFVERMHNGNEATKDAFGRTKRSSHKVNMNPMGTLGALSCLTPEGVEFKIGTGFDDALRQKIWNNREDYRKQTVTYSYQEMTVKGRPRCPVFKTFRSEIDL